LKKCATPLYLESIQIRHEVKHQYNHKMSLKKFQVIWQPWTGTWVLLRNDASGTFPNSTSSVVAYLGRNWSTWRLYTGPFGTKRIFTVYVT